MDVMLMGLSGRQLPYRSTRRCLLDQDAVVSALPEDRTRSVHVRMIDAAIPAGLKRVIPTEYGNNTYPAASKLDVRYEVSRWKLGI
ncbi:isoflavone reductase family protein [Penicillium chermesinum]|uniref:Isoflavone reductase family protein n=1 Tax=Penicillium chermesinum TaxID=63820 RepID=A0A9W9NZ45_9EURO|nr:isoflavone reductase family protein [Penicillium chermesinum]KAJ5232534.1 isoflavone reductase family protein [Penicillium chermesinum]KAJ6172190.1 isoflavone reductase family protein [Penicillium chermesinum]